MPWSATLLIHFELATRRDDPQPIGAPEPGSKDNPNADPEQRAPIAFHDLTGLPVISMAEDGQFHDDEPQQHGTIFLYRDVNLARWDDQSSCRNSGPLRCR